MHDPIDASISPSVYEEITAKKQNVLTARPTAIDTLSPTDPPTGASSTNPFSDDENLTSPNPTSSGALSSIDIPTLVPSTTATPVGPLLSTGVSQTNLPTNAPSGAGLFFPTEVPTSSTTHIHSESNPPATVYASWGPVTGQRETNYPTNIPTDSGLFFPTESPTPLVTSESKTSEKPSSNMHVADPITEQPQTNYPTNPPTGSGLFFPTETPSVHATMRPSRTPFTTKRASGTDDSSTESEQLVNFDEQRGTAPTRAPNNFFPNVSQQPALHSSYPTSRVPVVPFPQTQLTSPTDSPSIVLRELSASPSSTANQSLPPSSITATTDIPMSPQPSASRNFATENRSPSLDPSRSQATASSTAPSNFANNQTTDNRSPTLDPSRSQATARPTSLNADSVLPPGTNKSSVVTPTPCVSEAHLLNTTALTGATGHYKANPIVILHQSRASVTFRVEQRWVEWQMGTLSVHYEDANESSLHTCSSTTGVGPGRSSAPYNARCRNSVATVDVFVHDCSFEELTTVIPKECEASHASQKSASFRFMIPCDPHQDEDSCDLNSCAPQAKLEDASVSTGRYGRPFANPVNVLHYGKSYVEFQIEQTWMDEKMHWISVQYTGDSEESSCYGAKDLGINDSTEVLSAHCTEERAEINIFVHDSSFDGFEKGIEIPQGCQKWGSNQEQKTAAFRYSVPCVRSDEDICDDADKSCVHEAREDWKSVEPGQTGDYLSNPVKVLSQLGSTVEFQIDQTWQEEESVGWIGVRYEKSERNGPQCDSRESVQFRETSPTYKAKCHNGVAEIDIYVQDCSFPRNLDTSVPEICEPPPIVGSKVSYHFTLPCLCIEDISLLPETSSGAPTLSPTWDPSDQQQSDGSKRTVNKVPSIRNQNSTDSDQSTTADAVPTQSPTFDPVPLAQNNVSCEKDIFEDYETPGQSESWLFGSEFDDENFSTFLGRLGRDHSTVSKTFAIPERAASLQISFDFYDIDGMPNSDRILMGIQGSYLDLQLFSSDGQKKYYNDIEVTRDAAPSRQISFRVNDYDTIYSVKMKIPMYWYADHGHELPISFRVETDQEIFTESYGIDNFRIHAVCVEERNLATKEPNEYGEDGSSYCSAKDFPCDDGNMVYVCHYSARLGYQTFCIPEADSEVLRFYKNDYCGPCVGGFAPKRV